MTTACENRADRVMSVMQTILVLVHSVDNGIDKEGKYTDCF
jgi:hypothetical protein